MREQRSKFYEHVIHPYVFMLKEGREFQNDFLDYSLLLLQVGQAEVLQSPHKVQKPSTPTVQLLKR